MSQNKCPRIYVACLASYNSGRLYGRWIDATQSAFEIHEAMHEMLQSSPEAGAEEWAVHDYEGFGEISLGEWPEIERVAKLAELIHEHGDAFSVWYASQDGHAFDVSELADKFSEQWQGAFDSEIAFADHLLDSTGALDELPEWARNYFDYQGYARDLRLGGDYSFVRHAHETFVFSNY